MSPGKHIFASDSGGFTLIELIAVLVILGVLAVGASMGLFGVIRGAVFAEKNSEALIEAQHQLARMAIELASACDLTNSSSSTLTYKTQHGDETPVSRTLTAPSGASFGVTNNSTTITITMSVQAAAGETKVFTTSVSPYKLVSGYGCIE